jgi:hypothetical protein
MGDVREALKKYEKVRLHEVNEAQTRIDIIDRLLFEILGWNHEDVKVEERVAENGKSTFADFVVRTAITGFVVEAKKVGRAFKNLPTARRTKIRNIVRVGNMSAPIRQARDYARTLGLGFAIVTNGSQWIIYPASRTDQISFERSDAIVFNSLQSILETDLEEFVDLLSREAVISGSLENTLLGKINSQIEERRLNRFYPQGTIRPQRTNLFPLIQPAIDTAFTDDFISEDADLLEKCYVSTPDRIRFDSRIQMHIAKRQLVIQARPARPMKPREQRVLAEIIDNASGTARPVAVLVLGLVGAGKTTFLNYTRNVSSKARFLSKEGEPYPHWLYVDFRAFSAEASPYDYICGILKKRIQADRFLSDGNRCIQHAYKDEIDGISRGPLFLLNGNEDELKKRVSDLLFRDYEATVPYVEKILSYVARHAAVFLVIDNVDQVTNEGVQAKIFADSMALAQKLKCNLILSMRDTTYLKNRNSAVFDAFDFDAIYIDAPKLDAVLSKRFKLAEATLRRKTGDFVDPTLGSVHVPDLSIIIGLAQSSVLGTEIGTLIDVFSVSDVRLALRMTREFLQNGYTATAQALHVYEKEGRYTMPRHDALRAIILGSRSVYSEEYSIVGNPFDARLPRLEAQLLRLFILSALVASASDRNFQYMEGNEIAHSLKIIGFSEESCIKVIGDLCNVRFIQTAGQNAPTLEENYSPTRLGGYIVRHLIGELTFVQHMMMDTFVDSDEVWTKLRGYMDRIVAENDVLARVDNRVQCSQLFFEHIRDRYDTLRSASVDKKLAPQWCANPLKAMENIFHANCQRAIDSARKNYGPEGRLKQYRFVREKVEL